LFTNATKTTDRKLEFTLQPTQKEISLAFALPDKELSPLKGANDKPDPSRIEKRKAESSRSLDIARGEDTPLFKSPKERPAKKQKLVHTQSVNNAKPVDENTQTSPYAKESGEPRSDKTTLQKVNTPEMQKFQLFHTAPRPAGKSANMPQQQTQQEPATPKKTPTKKTPYESPRGAQQVTIPGSVETSPQRMSGNLIMDNVITLAQFLITLESSG
jgi:hypothetical protein